ncbi:IclR family transcriptional regulator [Bradyrhizobium tunisiense]|uniref:IclR family transcriptional regulator n=1 Tax=Bradyrhizobium tunisiense TaxID=3278709 RepID=UPI0035DDDD20
MAHRSINNLDLPRSVTWCDRTDGIRDALETDEIGTSGEYIRKERPWSSIPVVEDVSATPAAVKSAARALRILEFFDEVRRSARANEIADRLQIPQSSTSVLLTSLVRLGYIEFDGASKAYLPSLRVTMLATWRDSGRFRDGSVVGLLERLAAETGLAACLLARSGIFTRYLHVVQASKSDGVHIPLSVRRFAVKTAGGIVLIADMSEADLRALVHQTRAEGSGISLTEVMERVKQVRTSGYYLSAGLVHPENGGVAIALPMSITGGWQKMAVSVAGACRKVVEREAELVVSLTNAVRRIDPTFSLPCNCG